MTHRIRILTALAAILGAVFAATPASAGPSSRQPAQVKLSLGEARYYARVGASYLTDALVHPDKPHVGACRATNGRRLWMCNVTTSGSDTRCSVVVWVWGDREMNRYYEFHGLRCD